MAKRKVDTGQLGLDLTVAFETEEGRHVVENHRGRNWYDDQKKYEVKLVKGEWVKVGCPHPGCVLDKHHPLPHIGFGGQPCDCRI